MKAFNRLFQITFVIFLVSGAIRMSPVAFGADDVEKAKQSALDAAAAREAELVRRQEGMIRAQQMIEEGDRLNMEREWDKAYAKFQEAQKNLTDAPSTGVDMDRLHRGMSITLYELAKIAFAEKDYAKAASMAEQAYQAEPENREALSLAEQAGEKNRAAMDQQARDVRAQASIPKEVSNEKFVSYQKKVMEYYRAAENYFKSEQFDAAEQALKDVLRLDPYSATAYHRLREVQVAKYRKLIPAAQQTETESMLDVQNGWKMPIRRERTPRFTTEETSSEETIEKANINRKLKTIVIKKLNLQDATLQGAVNFLTDESIAADPEKKGVNFFVQMPSDSAGSTPPPEGGDATAPASTGAAPLNKITLKLQDVPLNEVIKYITDSVGFKYRIDKNAVVIYSGTTVTPNSLVTRTFNVRPGAMADAGGSTPTGALGGGSTTTSSGPLGGGGARTPTANAASSDKRRYFEGFGIDFPAGTSASLIESSGKLIVVHKPEVLDQIENILLTINQVDKQVQVEAKFIDIKQSDLEELGFRWAFSPASQEQWVIESGAGTALSSLPIGGPYRGLANPLTSGNRSSTSINASALDALLAGTTGGTLAGANTVLTVTGLLTNPQIQMFIDALSQKGLTNLLSAPRVTVKSTATAKILVTREFIYPSSYTDPQVSTGSGNGGSSSGVAVVGPSPSGFTTREVGVILSVTPTVGSDNETISLTLAPEVVDFEGFINYTSNAQAGSSSITFTIPQPIFNKRTLETTVTIWDQQTIVLGGLIRDDTSKFNDKIPLLGDIPFIGRLFQSKVETSIKRNLMIFLTAKIVDPSGKPVKAVEEIIATPSASSSQ